MLIDWDRVRELRDEIGAEDFAEVAELFIAEVQASVTDALDGSADGAGLEGALHSIKGAALNLGFARLATLAAEGEKLAATGQVPGVLLPEVGQIFAASVAEYSEGVPNIGSAA